MSALLERTERMGREPIGRLLFKLGVPGMISMFMMSLYGIINTFWVGQLGPDAIAATAVVFPYHLLVLAFGIGSGAGFGSLIARRFGERRLEVTNPIAGQVFALVAGFGVCFFLFTTFWPGTLLHLFGTTENIFVLARDYLHILGYGVFFTLFSMMISSLLRGSGNTQVPMYILAMGTVLNAVLDPFLIYGWAGFPRWGVNGAAVASVIAQGTSAVANLIYMLYARSGFRLRWPDLRPRWDLLVDIYRVGLPAFIMQFTAGLILVVLNHVLVRFGSDAIAANGLIFRTVGLIMMPIAGISQGLLPLVGYNFGAQQPERLWRAVRLASIGSLMAVGVGYVGLQLWPHLWVQVFTHDPRFLPVATQALRLTTLALPLLGPQFMWITTFQGLGQGRTAMVLSLLRQGVLLLPLLLILPHAFGISGVWLSLPISDSAAFLLTAWWIRRRRRQPVLAPQGLPPEAYPERSPDWVD